MVTNHHCLSTWVTQTQQSDKKVLIVYLLYPQQLQDQLMNSSHQTPFS